MATRELRTEAPRNREERRRAGWALRHRGLTVRVRGGGTKLGWAHADARTPISSSPPASTRSAAEHNAGDLTAVLEPGVPLARAQARFAEAGQMLALDPPLGAGGAATVGGVLATADSGPLRHRYGGAARPGGGDDAWRWRTAPGASAAASVIKNVAGYDIAKLFSGSFGTLGLIVEVAVRLHPLPPETATAVGRTDDPARCWPARRSELAHARWSSRLPRRALEGGRGRAAGPLRRRRRAAAGGGGRELMARDGLDAEVAAGRRRALAARSATASVRRTAGRAGVGPAGGARRHDRRACRDVGGSLVGRAALGLSWIRSRAPTAAGSRREPRRFAACRARRAAPARPRATSGRGPVELARGA